jgi:hypothetical protein
MRKPTSRSPSTAGSPSRRRFLGTLGASALATSAVVFGSAEAASATYRYACCNLVYRPTISTVTCRATCNYTWYCSAPPRSCTCCERKSCSSGAINASAYYCDNS